MKKNKGKNLEDLLKISKAIFRRNPETTAESMLLQN